MSPVTPFPPAALRPCYTLFLPMTRGYDIQGRCLPGGDPSFALQVQGLSKSFGGRKAVEDLGFELRPGEIFSLLGPNGAGKTTTIKILYGSLRPDGGTVRYGGRDFASCRREVKLDIGICSQNDTLDYDLDVRDNLEVFASYYRMPRAAARERSEELIGTFGLGDYRRHRPRILSGGLKRRLQIARALVNNPRVLFLDEPTVGLDPHARRELWDLLHRLREEKIAIILTTHYMDEAETLADRVTIMHQGRAIAEGSPAELLNRHLGELVLQVTDTPGTEKTLHALGVPFFKGYGKLSVWTESATADRVIAALPGQELTRRRPNLEDLFIKLTGRSL